MAEQIDELFVRLGLEKDDQQFKEAENSFDSLRTTALQFGAAIGAGIGLNELTIGFAESANEARKLAEEFEGLGVTPRFVDQLRGAFELIQADASEAESTIRNIADLIENTDWGQIPEDALARGFDISAVQNAESVREAMFALSEQLSDMDVEQARRVGNALGFSSDQIRLLQQGNVGSLMGDVGARRDMSQGMTQAAEQFDTGVTELTQVLDGFKRELSETFVGDLGEGLSDIASILEENRDAIQDFADKAIPPLTGAAAGIGTLVALRSARAGLGLLSQVPGSTFLAAGIGAAASDEDLREDMANAFNQGINTIQRKSNRSAVADALRDMGILEEDDQPNIDRSNERLPDPDQMMRDLRRQENNETESTLPSQDEIDRMLDEQGRRNDDLGFRMNLTPDIPGTPAGAGGQAISYNVNVDARGATDPRATEEATQRGVEKALARAAGNTVDDMRSPVA